MSTKVRIFMEDEEWYPVPTPVRIRRKDIGATVEKDLVTRWNKAQKEFWKVTRELQDAYQEAQVID